MNLCTLLIAAAFYETGAHDYSLLQKYSSKFDTKQARRPARLRGSGRLVIPVELNSA
jgi:hypothetical protein